MDLMKDWLNYKIMNTDLNPKTLVTEPERNIRFTDLFDLEEIQSLQDLFADVHGVASIITYPDGTPITRPGNFTRLCSDIIRKTDQGCLNCFKSDAAIGRHNPDGPIVQHCLSGGLWDAGASITVGNTHIANWLIGQVRNEVVDEEQLMCYAVEIGAKREEFLAALNEVPVMSFEQFNKVAKMLFVFANQLSEKAHSNLQLKIQIAENEKAIELLQKSEESLSIMLHSIGDGILSTDNNGLIVDMNPVAEHLCGWKLENGKGKPLTDVFNIINSKTRKPVIDPVKKVLENGQIIGLANHTVLISKDGTEYQIADSAAPIKNKEGLISGVVLVFSDVTEKYKADDALLSSEEKYRTIFENIQDVFYQTDLAGNILEISPSFKYYSEFNRNELIGSPAHKLYNNPADRDILINEIMKNGELRDYEVKFKTNANKIKFASMNARLIRNTEGIPTHIDGVIRDITERKLAEKDLIESEEKYRYLFANNPQPMWIIDGDTLAFLEVNQAAINHYGYSREEFLTMTIKDIRPVEDIRKLEDNIALTSSIINRAGTSRHLKKDGQIIFVEITSHTVYFNGRNARHVLVNDITARMHAEKELIDSRQQLLDIIDFLPDATIVVDNEKKVIAWNKAIEVMTGVPKQEMIGKGDHQYAIPIYGKKQNLLLDLMDTESGELDNRYSNIVSQGHLIHAEIFSPVLHDHQGAYLSVLGAPLFNTNGERIGSIESIRDITGRVKDEKALRNLSLAINQSKEVIFITDKEGIINFINPEFTKIYGYSSDEVIGKVTPRILKSKHYTPENYEYFWKTLVSKISVKDEYTNKRKDGSIIDIEGSAVPILDQNGEIIGFLGIQRDITDRKQAEARQQKSENALLEAQQIARIGSWEYDIANDKPTWSKQMFELFGLNPDFGEPSWEEHRSLILPEDWTAMDAAVKTAISEGTPYHIEFRALHPIEGPKWALTVGRPEYDNTGKLVRLKGTTQDINNFKLIEEQFTIAKEKAEESDRLKSAFLANMSHEVRTPLNSIIGFSELLADPEFEEETKLEFVQLIIANGNNLLTIISDIMDISKLESGEITIRKRHIKVHKFISGIKEQFSFQAESKNIGLILSQPDANHETIIFADSDRLLQIFNNLIGNALKFTANGAIEIGYHLRDKFVEFQIRDTGIGIPAEFHDVIFERFRQVDNATTRKYGGNGLGLAISKNLVELMGGRIWLESEPGKGSVFRFTLPREDKSKSVL